MTEELIAVPDQTPVTQSLVQKQVEAILFMAEEPVAVEKLAEILEVEKEAVQQVVLELTKSYEDRGIKLWHIAGGYKLGTSDECA
ncbi:MAG: SMC-Scp complex subunit ScpB, partial [Candidatus Margulisiibacteriota bacterium]